MSLTIKTMSLVWLLLSVIANASDLENTEFKHLSTKNGLSQNSVQTIFQDSIGFLWLGTQEGLNRFDGSEIRIYRHQENDPQSISHNVIRDITEDSVGSIWIATSGGLNRFMAASETFERVQINSNNGQSISRLNTLLVDSNGMLWVGTDGNGVFTLKAGSKDTQLQQLDSVTEIINSDIRDIFQDSRGRIWIGTDGDGIFLLSAQSYQQFKADENKLGSISHNRIRNIFEDSKGKIWIGTRGGGLNRFEELSKTFINYKHVPGDESSLSHDRVYQIFEDNQNTLWIATDDGLSVFEPEGDRFIQIKHKESQPSSLAHNRVLSIFQDRSGMIWFGTLSGLDKWNPYSASFTHLRHISEDKSSLSTNTVYALEEDGKGNILIGTFGGGLNYFDSKKVTQLTATGDLPLLATRVMSLMVDDKKNIWIGSVSNGVEVLSPSFEKILHYKNNENETQSLSANGVTDILQDSDGGIWVSTYNAGLNRLNKNTQTFSHYRREASNPQSLHSDSVFQIMEDDEGYIWVATDGGGLSRLDKNSNQFTNFSHSDDDPNSLSGDLVYSIYQDKKGRFWIGTQGNGLNLWEPENRRRGIGIFKHYTVEDGLNSSTVNGVLEDNMGAIWISTNRGVNKLDPDTGEIKNYNLADEIQYNEFNQNALLKARNSRFYFGGLRGVSTFFPSKIKENLHPPTVVLTKITSENHSLLFSKPLQHLEEVTFDHNDYLVSFEFAAIDFAQPDKNQYQYKLEGFDSDWINGGNLNRATFTNLPSGSYILKVRGSNNSGVWSDDSINLKVNVLPAPWMSWWAFTIYSMAFCLLLILMIRSQAKRLANQEVFRSLVSQKVEEKTSLYTKNTEFLKAQLDQFKHRSNVDLGTGLPNEKYLCDLLGVISRWTVQRKTLADESRLCIAFLRLPEINTITCKVQDWQNETIKQFTHQFRKDSKNEGLLVRWNERDIGIIEHFSDPLECLEKLSKYVRELTETLEMVTEQNEELRIKGAYVLTPFEGLNQDFMDSEKLLMLNEHLLHLVDSDPDRSIVGIYKLNQTLNNTNFKQILAARRLNELVDVFEFSPT